MMSCGWLWLYLGAFLMLAELLAQGFIVFFFGLAAASVGLCRFAFGDAMGSTWQVVAFSVFTVLYLFVLRRYCKRFFGGDRETSKADFSHELVGRLGTVKEAICPPRPGRVLIGDAEWTATAAEKLDAGSDVRVVAQENLTLTVERMA